MKKEKELFEKLMCSGTQKLLWKGKNKNIPYYPGDSVFPSSNLYVQFRFFVLGLEQKRKETYTRKEIENLLWFPCCHTSGMHEPTHYEKREYICEFQLREAFLRLCKALKLNPTTKSDPFCGWCKEYPEKKKGEGLRLHNSKSLKIMMDEIYI